MVNFKFEGQLMAPTFAPFNDDGSLNVSVVPAYAKHLRDSGVKGIWLNGTCGEGMSMAVEERKALAEAWLACRDVVGTIIVQCGAGCLRDTQELARHAESKGADGVAVFPCIFDKPQTEGELVDYLQEVAKACPNTPLFYYHIPMKTDVNLSMSRVMGEAVERIPTIAGLKYTDGDVAGEGKGCLGVAGGTLTVFNGFDQCLQEAIAHGFECGVNVHYNYAAAKAEAIFSLMANGRVEEAKAMQKDVIDMQDVICRQTSGFKVSAVKAAMEVLTGVQVGPSRLPVKPFSQEMKEALRKDLKEYGVLKE